MPVVHAFARIAWHAAQPESACLLGFDRMGAHSAGPPLERDPALGGAGPQRGLQFFRVGVGLRASSGTMLALGFRRQLNSPAPDRGVMPPVEFPRHRRNRIQRCGRGGPSARPASDSTVPSRKRRRQQRTRPWQAGLMQVSAEPRLPEATGPTRHEGLPPLRRASSHRTLPLPTLPKRCEHDSSARIGIGARFVVV